MTEPDPDIIKLINFCIKYVDIYAKTQNGMKIVAKDNVILISSFMIRLAENFRGVVATAQVGIPINGFIILRAMAESYILMLKCMQDENFHNVYTNKYLIDEVNKLNKRLRTNDGDQKKITERILQLEEELVEGKKGYKTRDLFKELNKENVYTLIYVEGSSHIHCDVNTIDRYLIRDGNTLSLGTNHNLERDIVFTCSGAIDLFYSGYKFYTTHLGMPFKNFETFEEECREIREALSKKFFPIATVG